MDIGGSNGEGSLKVENGRLRRRSRMYMKQESERFEMKLEN